MQIDYGQLDRLIKVESIMHVQIHLNETAPAAPTADASNVISVCSDAYTDIEVRIFDPDWNQTMEILH